MSKLQTGEFKKGLFILYRDEICQIADFTFVNPGKGSAFVRTKLKNLKTGRVNEFTYKSGEVVEEILVSVCEMQYLYVTDGEYYFMNERTFEQVNINQDLIGDFIKYMKEGQIYQILVHEGQALGLRFPKKVKLKVIEADEAARGNTVSGAKKMVTVETGAIVSAPIFIKTGEVIVVDTEKNEYAGREGGQY